MSVLIKEIDVSALFGAAAQAANEHQCSELSPEVQIERLRDHAADLARKHTFKANDIIQIKPGLDVYKWPKIGQPCIVLEVLEKPHIGSDPDRHPEYGATLDLRLGFVHDNCCGQFCIQHYSSELFEPWGYKKEDQPA